MNGAIDWEVLVAPVSEVTRLAQTGQSLRRNSLSAFGPKRTTNDFGLGTVCPLMTVISTGRRNIGGQLAINNDDGLPNARPIAFSEPLRNQLSHNAIFSVALVPPRNL